jgi:hypothetical protein
VDGRELKDTLSVDLTIRVQEMGPLHRGHFFPYFDGLLLPDKDIIRTFINLFTVNLGENKELRRSVHTLLVRGWASLHNTSGGRVCSHMIYLLDIAINGGFRCRPVYNNSVYCGMLLLGDGEVFAHSLWNEPTLGPVLTQEIQSMTGHEEALRRILELVQGLPLRKTRVPAPIEFDLVTSPRRLHYVFRDRKFTPEVETHVSSLLTLLRFKQTFFKIGDEAQLLQTITAFTGRLDPDAPCDYMGGNMFTHKKVLSALLAYGPVAPSVINSRSANISLPITEAVVKKNTNAGRLPGIPIFTKAVQEAFEDWSEVRDRGYISFPSKGKDRNGVMRISGVSNIVNTDEDLGRNVLKAMVKMIRREKKRGAEDDDEEFTARTSEKAQADRQRKKARLAADAEDAFAGMGWGHEGMTEQMDED